jgi:hypothetical protein
MRYAILVKLGGEILDAQEADYDDYKGFLKCPECREPVFLRKAFIRNDIEVSASFVHHKAVAELSICELRVGKYSQTDVEIISTKVKGQRIQKLKISIWKFLKRNLTINLKAYPKFVSDAKRIKFLIDVIDYGMEILDSNVSFILDSTLPRVEILFQEKDPRIGIVPEMQSYFDAFLEQNKNSWKLHYKITKEALELFLSSQYMKDIRHRLLCCLCHPTTLQSVPELLDLNAETREWREKFTAYLTLQITFVFLTVDWVNIFNEK